MWSRRRRGWISDHLHSFCDGPKPNKPLGKIQGVERTVFPSLKHVEMPTRFQSPGRALAGTPAKGSLFTSQHCSCASLQQTPVEANCCHFRERYWLEGAIIRIMGLEHQSAQYPNVNRSVNSKLFASLHWHWGWSLRVRPSASLANLLGPASATRAGALQALWECCSFMLHVNSIFLSTSIHLFINIWYLPPSLSLSLSLSPYIYI